MIRYQLQLEAPLISSDHGGKRVFTGTWTSTRTPEMEHGAYWMHSTLDVHDKSRHDLGRTALDGQGLHTWMSSSLSERLRSDDIHLQSGASRFPVARCLRNRTPTSSCPTPTAPASVAAHVRCGSNGDTVATRRAKGHACRNEQQTKGCTFLQGQRVPLWCLLDPTSQRLHPVLVPFD